MKWFARMVFFSVIAMTAACMEQGSSPSNTTAPSLVTGGGTASPSNRSAGPVATASSAMTATMQFGQPNVGSDYPPVPPHDQSAHAKDNIVPRTVVIDKGGTVTFNTFGVHQVAIYAPGTEPDDIDTSDLVHDAGGLSRVRAVADRRRHESRCLLYACVRRPLVGGTSRSTSLANIL